MLAEAVIIAFASWRLASLLVHEDGPGHVFARLRRFAGVPDAGEIEGVLPELFSCVWCMSVWTALAMFALWHVWRPEPVMVIAASAGAIAIERWARGAA
jgi:Protein of unknown function (DUF1360)